jgi:A/G-specific adenine glycosylase
LLPGNHFVNSSPPDEAQDRPQPDEPASLVIDASAFRLALQQWGKQNFRPFPWRLTRDPYRILMAEVMLHRTQVAQVLPIYEAFIQQYPSFQSLGLASEADLHELLYSLGLRWRISLILKMAQEIATRFNGLVPQEREALLSLPGVSDYIASAVRCFVWNYPDALVDTNTVRVTGRLFGLEIKASSRRNRYFRSHIAMLVDPATPAAYNYALLDLAALVCTQKRPPDCPDCPVLQWCHFGRARLRV